MYVCMYEYKHMHMCKCIFVVCNFSLCCNHKFILQTQRPVSLFCISLPRSLPTQDAYVFTYIYTQKKSERKRGRERGRGVELRVSCSLASILAAHTASARVCVGLHVYVCRCIVTTFTYVHIHIYIYIHIHTFIPKFIVCNYQERTRNHNLRFLSLCACP